MTFQEFLHHLRELGDLPDEEIDEIVLHDKECRRLYDEYLAYIEPEWTAQDVRNELDKFKLSLLESPSESVELS